MKKKENAKLFIGIIIGFLLSSGVIYAATLYSATEVSYDNSSSGTSNTNVQTAIDELYELSKTHCPDGYVCREMTGVELLISKANGLDATYSDTTKGEMFAFSHVATEQTPATTDYRYIGSSPNNYITFNNGSWRIIGVVDGRIKIKSSSGFGGIYWDYKKSGVGSSTSDWGSNDWSDSQLMYALNPKTYTLKSGYSFDGTYIKDANGNIISKPGCLPKGIASGVTSYTCTPFSSAFGLNSTALSQIDTVTYYLGGPSSSSGQTAENYYTTERSNSAPTGRPASWTGQVGLMNPSDYGYTFGKGVDDTCYTDLYNCYTNGGGNPSASWLYSGASYGQMTISPVSNSADRVFLVASNGRVNGSYAASKYLLHPVVYLKSDIQLTGTGTNEDPYQIVLTN